MVLVRCYRKLQGVSLVPVGLGYADGKKDWTQIAIVPTADSRGAHGNEYMQLYRRVDANALSQLLLFDPGSSQGAAVRNIRFS